MLKLCFDEEVGAEKVELFRKMILKHRYPPSVLNTFSFKTTEKEHPVKVVRLQIPTSDQQLASDSKSTKSRASNVGVRREPHGGIRNIKGSLKRARHRNGVSSPRPSRKVNLSSDGSTENMSDGQVSRIYIILYKTSRLWIYWLLYNNSYEWSNLIGSWACVIRV